MCYLATLSQFILSKIPTFCFSVYVLASNNIIAMTNVLYDKCFILLTVSNLTLKCDAAEILEDVGVFEVCVVLVSKDLAITISGNLTFTCGDACCELLLIF